jgi:hypothetical protein
LFHDGIAGDAPIQWTNYILMRDIFHCTPSELKAQSAHDIAAVLVCMDIKGQVDKAKNPTFNLGAL